jgi:hypothetical protein
MDLTSAEQLDAICAGLGDAHAPPAGCKSRWQSVWPATVAAAAYAFLGGADRLAVEAVCRTWRGHSLASGDAVSANAVCQLNADGYTDSHTHPRLILLWQVVGRPRHTTDGARQGIARERSGR